MRFEVEPAGVEIRDGLGQNQHGGHGLNLFSAVIHEMAGWPLQFVDEPAPARHVPGLVVD